VGVEELVRMDGVRGRVVCALALAATISGCGESGTSSQTSVVGPSSQTATTSSAPIDSRCMLPRSPANAKAVVKGAVVSFTWSAVDDVRDYVVAVGETPGGSQTLFTSTTGMAYDWGAPAGSYFARVHSHNRCGTSEPSMELAFTIE
jgi:hypothetical protein